MIENSVLTYKQIVIIEKDYNDWKFSSNINEVIRVISGLFYKKILQVKKSTNAYDILKCA